MSAILPIIAGASTALLADCRAALGDQHVLAGERERDHWARTTLPSGTRPCAVVRPGCTAEVQAVVRLAAAARVPVHAVSRGRNWGYGDACAPAAGALLLDLGRMAAIRACDRQLGTATVEPGVSQGQLAAHLEALGGDWIADCTGAGPDASVIGNLAERGFGHSAYGDRFAHACAFEVVLGDGSVIETGFAGLPGARAAGVYKWGIGPSLDGLFTQGNLGLITRATVWLMPRPQARAMLLLRCERQDGVLPLIEAVRKLRLEGVLDSTVHVFNRMRLLGGVAPFPYGASDGSQALELSHPALVAALAREHRLPAWVASAALAGPPALVRASVGAVRARLRAEGFPGSALVLGPRRMALVRSAAALVPGWAGGARLRAQVGKLDLLWRLLAGQPDNGSLTGGGWRARRVQAGSHDPRDGGAGMVWVSPVLPATGAAVAEVEALARTVVHGHGFEHQVTYSFINPRALCGVTSICFDRDDPGQRARAVQCHDALLDRLLAAGYCPYRAAPMTVRRLWDHPVAAWDVLGRLRAALDPAGVLSPGRYLPSPG
jgi:4-cresol dehydrogenase (hydroxylating)